MKRGQLLFLIILSLSIKACKQNDKTISYNSITYWIDRELIMPELLKGKDNDTTDYDQKCLKADYKIVVYMDGNCPKCYDRLNEWKSIMKDYENFSTCFYFYIYSYDTGKIAKGLKRVSFTYRVFVDLKNQLFELNSGLEQLAYSTFLLDDKNKILLVGRPFVNFKMRKLYDEIVIGKLLK